jgi:hypothetical protein
LDSISQNEFFFLKCLIEMPYSREQDSRLVHS